MSKGSTRSLAALAMLLIAGLAVAPAHAIPVTWTLQNATFTDGGQATGSFEFDADIPAYSNINITTTAGAVFGGASYGDPLASSGATFLAIVPDASLPDLTGVPVLLLNFAAPLTNAGGVITALTFNEQACLDPTCSFAIGGRAVPASQAQVVSQSVSVPEPTTLILFGVGLAGLVGLRRRRRVV